MKNERDEVLKSQDNTESIAKTIKNAIIAAIVTLIITAIFGPMVTSIVQRTSKYFNFFIMVKGWMVIGCAVLGGAIAIFTLIIGKKKGQIKGKAFTRWCLVVLLSVIIAVGYGIICLTKEFSSNNEITPGIENIKDAGVTPDDTGTTSEIDITKGTEAPPAPEAPSGTSNSFAKSVRFITGAEDVADFEVIYNVGDLLQEPSKIVRLGYRFDGWYVMDEEWNFELDRVREGEDMRLRAKWHRIVFNIDYGEYKSKEENPTEYSSDMTFKLYPPLERFGYKTDGFWYNTNGQKVEIIARGTEGDLQLKAMYSIIPFEIRYILNDSINPADNKTSYTVDEEVNFACAEKKNYIFSGWFTSSTFNKDSKIIGIQRNSKAENLVLYADVRTQQYSGTYITTAAGFKNMSDKAGTYVLLNDIDLGSWDSPFAFRGTFDGRGNKITYKQDLEKLIINNNYDGGLFKDLFYGALIKNLVVDCTIFMNPSKKPSLGQNSRGRVGGLSGMISSSLGASVYNVFVTGQIFVNNGDVAEFGYENSDGTGVGGVIGFMYAGSLRQVRSDVKVFVQEGAGGGLVGAVWAAHSNIEIKDSYVNGGTSWVIRHNERKQDILLAWITVNYGGAGGIAGTFKNANSTAYTIKITRAYVETAIGGETSTKGAIIGDIFHKYWDANRRNLTITDCWFNANRVAQGLHNLTHTADSTILSNLGIKAATDKNTSGWETVKRGASIVVEFMGNWDDTTVAQVLTIGVH